MKKKLVALGVTTVILATTLVGCGGKDEKTITVGASISPHAEILEAARPQIEAAGYTLEIKEFTDYVIPNTALDDGDLDANFFQHLPYLEDFNAEKGTELSSVADVHFEPLGIYPGKTASLEDIKEGAVVGVPNDTTNEARALLLLEAQGLIKLKEDAGLTATKLDVVENPLNLDIQEIEAAQLPRTLQDLDIACINGNYALEGKLDLASVLASESIESISAKTFANIIAVQTKNVDTDKTKALVKAVQSEEVRKFIDENYEGLVVPVY